MIDRFFGWLNEIRVTGVELDIEYDGEGREDYMNNFRNNSSYKMLDARGLFKKGRTGVVVLEDGINLQIRSNKAKSLDLLDCLEEVQSLKEEIVPDNFDLFSFMDQEAV